MFQQPNAPAKPKNASKQFEQLGKRQAILMQGIEDMKKIQEDLLKTKNAADKWALVAVLSNAVLLPCNIIINAFELGTAKDIYQLLVREVYSKYAKSGSRTEGNVKAMLSVLKKSITEALTKNGLKKYVPGVNILVGFSEDASALIQTIIKVDKGSKEINALVIEIQRKMTLANQQIMQLGIIRADLLEEMKKEARTA